MKFLTFPLLALSLSFHVITSAQPYGQGLDFLSSEEYLSLPVAPRYRSFLPASADLSEWLPAVGSQGEQGSCVAWATTYYMRSYYENRQSPTTAKQTPLSPAFVYNQLKKQDASCKTGLNIGMTLEFLRLKGAPPLRSFPYSQNNCSALPDQVVESVASQFKIESWKRLTKGNLDDVKGEIARDRPVVIGMRVSEKFKDFRGKSNFDELISESETRGGHAMTVVGYDDSRQAFRLVNSWGQQWGDRGFAWISYESFNSNVRESYTATVTRNLIPVAVNAPEPLAVKPPEQQKPVPSVIIAFKPPEAQPEVPPVKPEQQKPAVLPPPPVVAPPEPVVTPAVISPPAPVVAPPEPAVTPPPKPVVTPPIVSPPKPVVPPAPIPIKPPVINLADVQSKLAKSILGMQCAAVKVERVKGVLQLSGFVGNETDASAIRDLLSQVGDLAKSTVQLRPWPQCEGLITLAKPLAENAQLNIDSNKKILIEGDKLRLDIKSPNYPSYIYVSYLQADGQVVHLHRYSDQGNKPIPAGTSLVLGAKGEYVVSGPTFGPESVFVVASALPLLTLDRPQFETEREYLTQFRLAILAHQAGRSKVSSVFLPLTTSK